MSDTFSPFGLVHAIVLLVSVAGWTLVLRLARAGTAAQRWSLAATLAASILAVNLFWFLDRLAPGRFSLSSSLPLHLCDLAWMVAIWALVQHDRDDSPAHQLLFFWGLGLSTQAFLTPTLGQGPARARFWFFWLPHWQIVAVALLDLLVHGRRPTWRGFRFAAATTVIVGLAVTAFNLRFDTPYFFTGRGEPDNPTIIDRLGAWPGRLWIMGALVLIWFALLRLVFGERRRPDFATRKRL